MGQFREAGAFHDELRALRKTVSLEKGEGGPFASPWGHTTTKSAENHFEYDEWAGKQKDGLDLAKSAILSAFKAADTAIDEKRAEDAAFEEALTVCTKECVQEASQAIIAEIGSEAAAQTDVGSDVGAPSVAESGGGKWWWQEEREPWRLEDEDRFHIAPASEGGDSSFMSEVSPSPVKAGFARDAHTPSTAVPQTPGMASTTTRRGARRGASRGRAGSSPSRPGTKGRQGSPGRGVPPVQIPAKNPDEVWRIQTELPTPPPPGATPRAVMGPEGWWW
jgi:hypothetical protein